MLNSDEYFPLLRRMPIFGGLKDSALGFILAHSVVVSVEAEGYFFREGDVARTLYVLIGGTVIIEKIWEGVPIELRSLGEGDCFGEMAIIDLLARSASVRARTDCQAIVITRATLHELYQHDLEQYAILMMNMGREVSRRLRIASERLFELDRTLAE